MIRIFTIKFNDKTTVTSVKSVLWLNNYLYFVIFLAIALYDIPVAFAGTQSTEALSQIIDNYINNADEDRLEQFQAFLQEIAEEQRLLPPMQEMVEHPEIERQRFGWESLGIFIGATILGYIFIRYGADITNGIKDFLQTF